MFLGIFSVWGVSFCLSAYSSKCFTGMIMCFLSLGTLSHDFIKSVLCTLLSYPSSYSSPLTTSKFSCTQEILHVLSVLSYFFFFFVVCMFYFSSLFFRSWCFAFHFLDLISVASFIFSLSEFQFDFSVFLFIEFLIHFLLFSLFHSDLCFYSLLMHSRVCVLFDFFLDILLIILFNSLSGTLLPTLSNHHCGVVGFWFFVVLVCLPWPLYILD